MASVSRFRIFVLSIIIFIGTIFIVSGQFGITSNYHIENLGQANTIGQTAIFPEKIGIVSAGVNYWFSLKNYRAEFYPGVQFSHSLYPNLYQIKENAYQLELPIHFFLFDFKNECNCPTFGREDGWFKKSFFVKLNTIYKFNNRDFIDPIITNEQKFLFYFGLGIGLDLAVNKNLDIIPSISYLSSSNDRFRISGKDHEFNRNNIQFGLSFLLRKNDNKRRR